ncbi:hypothetical protein EFK50_19085 [Nocardioides marmoriginsengisoli]|uniref:Uncharacterized protein n=1 Tax=Nocardioides marmoriginsengisoli TaxID=661483 RepID=A0A3N0CAU3_9ACTN|nr:hypothetical protein [Nocardioides marmoriginsengisoli]RNL60439.1 hypothetical protein EFK50_19085 [Nocardioides marmoriginsengisoli]
MSEHAHEQHTFGIDWSWPSRKLAELRLERERRSKLMVAPGLRFPDPTDLDEFTVADLRLIQAFYAKRSDEIGPLYYAGNVSDDAPDDATEA